MVAPVSFGLSKGLVKSSSKSNLAAMGGANYSGSAGLLNKPSSKPKEGGAPTLLKRSRSMGTFGNYVNFGQQAVEEISGKSSIGATGEVEVQGTSQSAGNGTAANSATEGASTGEKDRTSEAASSASASSAGTAPASSSSGPSSPPAASPQSNRSEDTPELVDDNNLHHMPMARVDYFSHEWNESDLAGSWRYIVSRRQDMANSARLENASWRTWAKAKYKLKTVRPETVNWLKDYDVTWLYGPLYHERSSTEWDKAEPINPLPEVKKEKKADSIKSILKKKTIAEIMLEDTPDYQGPTDNYLRHHNYRQITSDCGQTNIAKLVNSQYSQTTTRVQTPEPEDKRVHFNARVEQCISLDPEETQQQESESESDSESEEGGLFLGIQRHHSSNTSLASNSSSRTIAPLPATTLNMPDDAEDAEEEPTQHITGTRNYDYNSVYTGKSPAFKIVDPKVQAVELPQSVQSVMSKTNVADENSKPRPSVSFGCK